MSWRGKLVGEELCGLLEMMWVDEGCCSIWSAIKLEIKFGLWGDERWWRHSVPTCFSDWNLAWHFFIEFLTIQPPWRRFHYVAYLLSQGSYSFTNIWKPSQGQGMPKQSLFSQLDAVVIKYSMHTLLGGERVYFILQLSGHTFSLRKIRTGTWRQQLKQKP